MKSVEDALGTLGTRYRRRERQWLLAALGGEASARSAAPDGPAPDEVVDGARGGGRDGAGDVDRPDWPLVLPLGAPDERTALERAERFRDWQREWRAWAGPGELRFASRRWTRLGRQELPTHLVLPGPGAVADTVGAGARWRRLLARAAELVDAAPGRLGTIGALVPTLDALGDADWPRWRAAADWLDAHPRSGLYPRQLPIAGADTKTLEGWRPSLERWLAGAPSGARDAPGPDGTDPLGLRTPPVRVRVRALDAALPGWPAGLTDLELPVDELAALGIAPARALVVENLQSGLALPALPGTLAVIGRGYAIGTLERLPWLRGARIDYWGDVDTHGLAMLALVRSRFDRVRSVLMDERTLLAHRALWVEEPAQTTAEALDALTDEEAALYADLRRGRWGVRVRLEQERLAWPGVLAALGA